MVYTEGKAYNDVPTLVIKFNDGVLESISYIITSEHTSNMYKSTLVPDHCLPPVTPLSYSSPSTKTCPNTIKSRRISTPFNLEQLYHPMELLKFRGMIQALLIIVAN